MTHDSTRHRVLTMYGPHGLTLSFISGGKNKKAHNCWSQQGSKGKGAVTAAEL